MSVFLLALFILCILSRFDVKAQDIYFDEEEGTSFIFDEIPVLVIIEGYGSFYTDVIYTNNDLLYVNVGDLFNALKIPCVIGKDGDSIGGFIENESRPYSIDYNTKEIKVGSKIINSQKRMVKEMGTVFLESSLFYDAFGITLTFNFRSLTIILKSDFELPIIKLQRLEKIRSNISKLKGEIIADTVVQRNYHLFKFGMLDWSVNSLQKWNEQNDNRFGLGIGTEFLYGEANVSVDYYDRYKFDNRQLRYIWRWVDNDKTIIKQAQVGKIYNQSIAHLSDPVVGAVIRNSPTAVRKASGYYTINDYTEPNWTVELYINNVLVDYTKADASGLYIFKVPIVYGFTTLKLKFYGPMGEERIEERTMNVPYTVMPTNEFEYGLSAGIVQDSSSSRFGKTELNYGVNRFLTVGGGLEYLSSISNGAFIPYAKATFQPFSKLIINSEYAHGVKTRGLLNYYFLHNALLEIDYSKFVEGQRATIFNALEERKAKISIPFRVNRLNGFAKSEYSQFVYSEFKYSLTNILISAYYRQFSANSSVQLNWINNMPAYVTSDLALSYRLLNGFTLRPSAQFNIREGKFITCKAEIEKRIPKGYLSVSYQKNILFNDNFININFKYDLPYARTNITASHNNGNISTSEGAQGSLAFSGESKNVYASKNSSVGKGGILLYPFLDLNNNGIFDKDEHLLKLTKVKVMSGKAIFSEKDSIVRILELNEFTNYIVEFDDNDLENIAWRFKDKIYQVLIDPNQFKHIDVPVVAVGEVSGTVFINNSKTSVLKGIGRILIKFYKKNSDIVVAEILSESDGYIYYMGLEPGEYVARVDSVQLSNLNFTADPPQKDFTIKALEDGDIVEGIDFILKPVSDELFEITPDTIPNTIEFIDPSPLTETEPVNVPTTDSTLQKADSIASEIIEKTQQLKVASTENVNNISAYLTALDEYYKKLSIALDRMSGVNGNTANAGKVSGVVKNFEGSLGIVGVKIYIIKNDSSVFEIRTDSNGKFLCSDLKAGAYTIKPDENYLKEKGYKSVPPSYIIEIDGVVNKNSIDLVFTLEKN